MLNDPDNQRISFMFWIESLCEEPGRNQTDLWTWNPTPSGFRSETEYFNSEFKSDHLFYFKFTHLSLS